MPAGEHRVSGHAERITRQALQLKIPFYTYVGRGAGVYDSGRHYRRYCQPDVDGLESGEYRDGGFFLAQLQRLRRRDGAGVPRLGSGFTVILRLFFRNAIPTTFDREKISAPQTAIRDSRTFMPGWLVLVGFFTLEPLGVTVNLVAALANRHFLARHVSGGVWPAQRRADWLSLRPA